MEHKAMDPTLLKALIALVPVSLVFAGSLILYIRSRTGFAILQLIGSGCLILVVLVHFCEALHFLTWMRWGQEGSAGHYLDLASVVLGLTLYPLGFLLHALAYRQDPD